MYLVTAAEGMPGEEHRFHRGDDKFAQLYPECEPHAQFQHGEKIGLGSMDYELRAIAVPPEPEE